MQNQGPKDEDPYRGWYCARPSVFHGSLAINWACPPLLRDLERDDVPGW